MGQIDTLFFNFYSGRFTHMDLTNLNLNKDRSKIRRKPSVDLSTMVYGKVPPQAKELEEAVLGAIMLEKSAFDTVVEILKPECFLCGGAPAHLPRHAGPGSKKPADRYSHRRGRAEIPDRSWTSSAVPIT
jgi:hypothetical protein